LPVAPLDPLSPHMPAMGVLFWLPGRFRRRPSPRLALDPSPPTEARLRAHALQHISDRGVPPTEQRCGGWRRRWLRRGQGCCKAVLCRLANGSWQDARVGARTPDNRMAGPASSGTDPLAGRFLGRSPAAPWLTPKKRPGTGSARSVPALQRTGARG
jgi:hypothetical protein